jgi:hypothetical protein
MKGSPCLPPWGLVGPRFAARVGLLGAVTEPHAVRRLLAALGLAAQPPPEPPSRGLTGPLDHGHPSVRPRLSVPRPYRGEGGPGLNLADLASPPVSLAGPLRRTLHSTRSLATRSLGGH